MSISEDNHSIAVNDENLDTVLAEVQACGVDDVAVISVVGAFRAGKSFLLDVFLRYLRNTTGDEDAFPEDPDGIPEWLTCGGSNMRLSEGSGEPGFSWRSGRERTTTGIWMFSKPFVRRDPNTGKQVAVLLMDTQGMFDMQTPPALTAAIFGLSTLISSFQIYNISRQIQEDTLQNLHFFTEFSKCALREYETHNTSEGEATDGRPFQRLEFLVRDWAHFDDNWTLTRCIEEMDFVLEDALVVNVRDAGTREQIRTMFDRITCFLLPHPGTDMTKPSYKGDLGIVEPSFLKLLNVYCHHVLDEGLLPKKVQGQLVTPLTLGHYIRAFTTCFNEGKVPDALTLVEAMSHTTNLAAKEKAHKLYKDRMAAVCGPECDFAEEEQLTPTAVAAEAEALELFAKTATFGKQEDIASAREALAGEIKETQTQMFRENQLKMDQSLVKFAPVVIIMLVAIVVDKVSDYTCDWWLNACVQMSSFLLFTYLAIVAFLCYMAYELYQRRGMVAATNGLLALSQASSRMGVEAAGSARKYAEDALQGQLGTAGTAGQPPADPPMKTAAAKKNE